MDNSEVNIKASEKNKFLLTPELMIRYYSIGAFPMADETTGEINWYYPQMRAIIPLDSFNIPRSLKQIIKKNIFEIKFDCATIEVIKQCANREKTWISSELIEAYKKIHKLGYVHSVEAYQKDKLVGGLYGISIGGAFFGESMFSIVENASKVTLVFLINHLKEKNFQLLDVQYLTKHLKMFGAIEISLDEFNLLLNKAYSVTTNF
ncbi:MAG: leucyl/phenylalanyl-tRNA--protein transferase [Ignavibacteria bacterium]|nr:leucyl/phenylalanyl-tRNA--protein transferase [Ignavibacteria bacterium]